MNARGISSAGVSSSCGSAGAGNSGGSAGAVAATGAGWNVTRAPPEPGKLDEQQTGVPPPTPMDFHVIYERWFDEVSRWIRALGGPEADREDLVQDVFVVVHRRLPDFDGENLPGWLYRIARHRVRDFRRLSWVKHFLFGSVPLPENLATEAASPAETLETYQKTAMLEQLLEKLTESERATLVLFEVDGYSGEEIAQIQGVPLNTVWSRIYKSRKRLKALLAKAESRRPSSVGHI